jgi:hypothetical protein
VTAQLITQRRDLLRQICRAAGRFHHDVGYELERVT